MKLYQNSQKVTVEDVMQDITQGIFAGQTEHLVDERVSTEFHSDGCIIFTYPNGQKYSFVIREVK